MRLIFALLFLPCVALAAPKGLPTPGTYECRVDTGYKFKPCTIKALPNGSVVLDVTPGLFGITGQIIADAKGKTLMFVGKLNEARPFGCFSCQAKCAEKPETCGCKEWRPAASNACREQPIVFALKTRGKTLSGTIARSALAADYENGKRLASYPQVETFKFVLRPAR